MLNAFIKTFRNLRTNFFQTFLSVLGIIIGVGALVAMLAMIDGLENWGEDMIADKSSLENVAVRSIEGETVDGIYVARDRIAVLDEPLLDRLLDSLPPARGQLYHRDRKLIRLPDGSPVGLELLATSFPLLEELPDSLLLHGSAPGPLTAAGGFAPVWINERLARRMDKDSLAERALDHPLVVFGDTLTVAGVVGNGAGQSTYSAMVGLATRFGMAEAAPAYPELLLAFERPSDVLEGQEITDRFLARHFADLPDATESLAQSSYLEDMRESLLVFRLVMGFLIGIAVVVGGIGVMNVLLMSITERTAEIGVRKAVGASRGTIVRQFLAEAVAISVIGCFFGVLLGMAVALAGAAGMSYFVEDLDFRAAFTPQTVVVVALVAVLIGVVFGTYPARKAAGLDPVEAIRR